MTRYDPRLGQYRGDNGQMVSRATVLGLVDEEVARMQVRLAGHARLLTTQKITISEFQSRVAHDLKYSHTRMVAFGTGGISSLTPQQYGLIGNLLRNQYSYLNNFGQDLASSEMNPEQIIRRTQSYARSAKIAFFRGERLAKAKEGFNEGRRDLDPQARHCESCIRYTTNGLWVPISEIVAPATKCECHGNCRCTVKYRRRIG
jgi:hypothetical protein